MERRRDGIPLHRDVVSYLDRLAGELGLDSTLLALGQSPTSGLSLGVRVGIGRRLVGVGLFVVTGDRDAVLLELAQQLGVAQAPGVDLATELDDQRAHPLARGLELPGQLLDLTLELLVVRRRFLGDRLELLLERLDLLVVEALAALLPLLDLARQALPELGLPRA